MFAGFWGLLTAVIVPIVLGTISFLTRKKNATYKLEPQGKPGAFEPLLQKYLRLAEFTIGLATGSIVLLVGSSVLHGKDGRLPSFYASPLFVLAASVLGGLVFMTYLIVHYEEWQHGYPHTSRAYAFTETCGYSALLLFVIGYGWLIFAVTR
jgi:hypothetical protein